MMRRLFSLLMLSTALLGGVPCAAAEAPAPGMHYFILTGQSNSLGAVKGTPASPDLLEKYRSSALLWNGNMNRDTGVCFEKNPGWRPVEPQLPLYNGNLCMGPEYGFCYILERRVPARYKGKLAVVKASLDGGGNHYWQPGGNAYKSLTNSVKAALAAGGEGNIEGLLYLQGESDAGEEVSLAAKRFTTLMDNLRREFKAEKTLRYAVVGQPANWKGRDTEVNGTTTALELEKLAVPRKKKGGLQYGWVRTRDLTKITSGDNMGVHYDGKSQLSIGARFGYVMLLKMGLPTHCYVRNDNPDAALESPSAWWNGAMADPGKSMKPDRRLAVWDLAAANTEDHLDGTLVLGGIRVEAPFRREVVISGKGTLKLGGIGIALQEGDLTLRGIRLDITAAQTWKIPAGCTLTLEDVSHGVADKPLRIKLSGEGKLVLKNTAMPELGDKGHVTVEQQ